MVRCVVRSVGWRALAWKKVNGQLNGQLNGLLNGHLCETAMLTFNKKLLLNSKNAFSKGKQAPRAPREGLCARMRGPQPWIESRIRQQG